MAVGKHFGWALVASTALYGVAAYMTKPSCLDVLIGIPLNSPQHRA